MSDLDAPSILGTIEAAIYDWSVETDRLNWSPSLPAVLASDGQIATGADWNARTDSEAMASRHSAVLGSTARDEGRGVPYELEYPVRIQARGGGRLVWIEDIGRWYGGPDGKPTHARGLVRVVTERHEADQRLAIQTRFDPLTGTLNRLKLLDVLDAMIRDSKRYQTSCALLLVAVENLAAMNEARDGATDDLISGVSKKLRAKMRAGDAIGRFSTTIFGLALANCTLAELHVAARRFMDAVHEHPVETAAGPIGARVTCAGIVAPRHAANQVEMVARVSDTLSEVRRKRRGSFLVFAPSQAREDDRRRSVKLAEELIATLTANRLVLAFQPVVDASDGEIRWYEALARIEAEDGSVTSVSAHVGAAEKLGLVHLLDRRVLELAVAALEANADAVIGVNISAETMGDAEWRDHLIAILRGKPAIGQRLLIEVTETAAPGDLSEAAEFVAALHEEGVRVAIDDFGAGQTSFRVLRALGVDLVKIDGEFVMNLAQSAEDRAFVRAIVGLARDVGFQTVAERVEDTKTADILRGIGVDFLQGDLFGAAGPLEPAA